MFGHSSSLWAATAVQRSPAIEMADDVAADVAIIGAGYTGCAAALDLAVRGVDVVVIDSEDVGWGGSGRNVGLVNAGLFASPRDIVSRLGDRAGRRLVDDIGAAPRLVRETIDRHAIECDRHDRGVIKGAHAKGALRELEDHVRQWREFGAPLELLDDAGIRAMTGSRAYVGGLVDHRSFTIHPLRYALGLARAAAGAGARLFKACRAIGIERVGGGLRIQTETGRRLGARAAILATGAYSDKLAPGLRRSFVAAQCFMFATAPLPAAVRGRVLPGSAALYDTRASMLFARYDRAGRLIVGSLGSLPSPRWVQRAIRLLFGISEPVPIEYGWSGAIDLTPDTMPHLYRLEPDVVGIAGYNGRGIGQGTYWGRVLADWVTRGSDEGLPVPVSDLRAIPLRRLRQAMYESAFRLARTWQVTGIGSSP